jgi:hypothetical protein
MIRCPVCDFEYNHIVRMEMFQDTENKLHVIVFCKCEEGHHWQLNITDRKGWLIIEPDYFKGKDSK